MVLCGEARHSGLRDWFRNGTTTSGEAGWKKICAPAMLQQLPAEVRGAWGKIFTSWRQKNSAFLLFILTAHPRGLITERARGL